MKAKYLLLAAAVLMAPLFFAAVQPAAAAVISNIEGTYSVTVTAGTGGSVAEPTVVDDGNRANSGEPVTLSSPFNTGSLTVGGSASSPTTFFTLVPAGSCTSSCTGAPHGWPCFSNESSCGNATATINVSFTFTEPSGAVGSVIDSATYTADYQSQTNSLDWTSNTLVVDFTDGAVAHILLPNQNDWDINPTISFQAIDPSTPSVPEPASIAILGTALVGFSWLRRRKKAA